MQLVAQFSLIIVFLTNLNRHLARAQSTCPVIQPPFVASNANQIQTQQQQQQRCKCGIKIDGHIYIYCARKQLRQLPKFTRSSILYDELILSGNLIQTVRANSFLGLKVKRLYLDDNPLRSIESNSFIELANYLEELYISVSSQLGNQLPQSNLNQNEFIVQKSHGLLNTRRTNLPIKLFQNLLNLKIIKLTGLNLYDENKLDLNQFYDAEEQEQANDFGVLKENLFNRTRKLEIIHLVDCNLRKIEQNSFSGVESSLRELNLDNNLLTSTIDVFRELIRMRRLRVLNLSRNKISQLNRFFENGIGNNNNMLLNELQLDLSFNSINRIDELAFGSIGQSIVKLNLNNNELNQFQFGFLKRTKFENIKELQLDYNKIEYIPDNLLQSLSKLEHLSLKGNLLYSLQSEFSFYGLNLSLKKLNLASNKIVHISKRAFLHCSKLRELNLERNQLSTNISFDGLDQELKHLNLESNSIRLDHLRQIKQLQGLETLKLANNPFDFDLDYYDLFRQYKNLSYLDLQNTNLKRVPYFVGLNQSLITLNLAQNSICHINALNLKRMYPKLRNLNLNLNPLRCDCNLIGLRQWLDEVILSNSNSVQLSLSTTPTISLQASSQNQNGDDLPHYMPTSLNWKCAGPNFNANKFLNRIQLSDLMCFEQTAEANFCELDEELNELGRKQTPAIITTTAASTTTSVSSSTLFPTKYLSSSQTGSKNSPPKSSEDIQLIDSNPILNEFTTKAQNLLLMKDFYEQQPIKNKESAQQNSSLFFSSTDLKQTLIGSLIGALSVLIIVFLLVCLIKVTNNRLRLFKTSGKNSSVDLKDDLESNSSSKKKKSPYQLGKLSLQTLCINSSGSSSSSSSASSTSSNNSQNTANTNCLCSIINPLDTATPLANAKIDPLRLTLMNTKSGCTLYHPTYFATAQQLNNNLSINNNNAANNLHYLASNLPYSPNETTTTSTISGNSSAASPIPPAAAYQLDFLNSDPNSATLNTFLAKQQNQQQSYTSILNSTENSNNNTYDKLHQQRLNAILPSTGTLIRVPLNQHAFVQNFNTLQNKLINSPNSSATGETTPFLIITDVNRFLLENSSQLINQQQQQHQQQHQQMILNDLNNPQHTYHEIGDILLNYNPRNNANIQHSQQQMQQHDEFNGDKKQQSSEMYI